MVLITYYQFRVLDRIPFSTQLLQVERRTRQKSPHLNLCFKIKLQVSVVDCVQGRNYLSTDVMLLTLKLVENIFLLSVLIEFYYVKFP